MGDLAMPSFSCGANVRLEGEQGILTKSAINLATFAEWNVDTEVGQIYIHSRIHHPLRAHPLNQQTIIT